MKKHQFDPDDPRLTAYALGELDEAERAEVEALLAESEEARAAVGEIEALGASLSEELASEPEVGLTDEQRGALEARLRGGPARGGRVLRMQRCLGGVAAALLVAVGGAWAYRILSFEEAELDGSDVACAIMPADSAAPPAETKVAPSAPRVNQLRALGYLADAPTAAQSGPATAGPATPGPPAPGSRARVAVAGGEYRGPGDTGPRSRRRAGSMAARDINGWAGEGDPSFDFVLGSAEGPRDSEGYDAIVENPFVRVDDDPLSTFSIDVDTASYSNVRRLLRQGQLPPPGAVRIEEMINYFTYALPQPGPEAPFSVTAEVAGCPWRPAHRLLRIGLQGREVAREAHEGSNLVFLLDVSGSMNQPDKLPLLKRGMRLLVDNLDERDRVSIVVYAGAAGLVLPPTSCGSKETILQAIENLRAGGSTNGGAGIELAYRLAVESFITGGVNRVILATDGDFNVGVSDRSSLVRMIEEKAKSGVFLTVLGFGQGNLKDSQMEELADKGNGNYAYIDSVQEARKVLVREMGGTLVTIAKDVKIQVEFNPAEVSAFRLIGYENRVLAHQDFNDDTKDAGEIGSGHTVTALYEIVPAGVRLEEGSGVDELRYQEPRRPAGAHGSGELLTVKLRYKEPTGDTSRKIEVPVRDSGASYAAASEDFKFAASVAAFGMVLRGSEHAPGASLGLAHELAGEGAGPDPFGYRAEFLNLVRTAMDLRSR